MKKILYFFTWLFITNTINAQMVYIPDSAFRQKLSNLGFGSCIINDSIDSSCPAVQFCTGLDISNSPITNLQGIQAFVNLGYLDCNHDHVGTIPPLPSTLYFLDCSGCALSSLPALPASLTTLKCDYSGISNIPSLPAGLKYLSCGWNSIFMLPALPDSLLELYCNDNLITSFPTFNNKLRTLVIHRNNISNPPIGFPDSLKTLYCWENHISNFNSLPTGLETLECSRNLLTSLPALPDSLRSLTCNQNPIGSLPALPLRLRQLICSGDSLIQLPALPPSLIELNCSGNFIDTLPFLPMSLIILNCSYSQIQSFTNIPQNIQFINCSNNNLTSLPPIPASLTGLNIHNNMISSLQGNFDGINSFSCAHNLFSSLPVLPDSLINLDCSYNSSLSCLPRFNYISDLNFDQTAITCLPGYGHIDNCTPPLSSVPLCDIFNINGCGFFWNIGGKTYFDSNNDCIHQSIDTGIINMHINLYESGNLIQQAFTGTQGYYSFDVNTFGNYSVELDTFNTPFDVICPSTYSYLDTISASDSLFSGDDFAMKCKNGFDIGVWSICGGMLRPGHKSEILFYAGDLSTHFGVHCAAGISGTVTVIINGNAQFDSIVPGALSPLVNGNVLTYNISDFGQVHDGDFGIRLITSVAAIPGSQVCFDVNVTPVLGDYNAANNVTAYCMTIFGSYDPNFKEAYPQGQIDSSQEWMTYTIHFQNTGNAPAENIFVLDTIESDLDISSFLLLSMSHNCYAQILDGGIARFNFPNINLPDSTSDEPMSHGFVQYKIRLRDNLSQGAEIKNTAYIYFDQNSPIITNTTLNTINLINGITQTNSVNKFNVTPSPFDDYFIIRSEALSEINKFTIFNSLGMVLKEDVLRESSKKINTEDWPAGMYFVKSNSGNYCVKIIRK